MKIQRTSKQKYHCAYFLVHFLNQTALALAVLWCMTIIEVFIPCLQEIIGHKNGR